MHTHQKPHLYCAVARLEMLIFQDAARKQELTL
jgi:hypothetical protein